ncbi:carbonic anhydrase [Athelia psychrophila]|uniref:Carbonic anhydrase n=1 Tax=Athelia psychrophila TaxID=1759441 RepID=A0A166EGH6_9AGAM|nr:carbonic anhydrase [Fibularhizoctonia sp. CBS 109695]KZP15742.1 carbonic anhydrase [Fibularhizoctonia sp. CBS 109695]
MNAHTAPTAQRYAQACNDNHPAHIQSEVIYMPGPEPTNKVAIVTCMDARLDVFKMFGLKVGEAHVIRVGGGRTPDALRSLVASEHILETKEIMVVHHTDCGFMRAPTDEEAHTHIEQSLQKANGVKLSTRHLPIQVIQQGDLNRSVCEDVQFLHSSPYIRNDAVLTGWIYDTMLGTIKEVREASAISQEGKGAPAAGDRIARQTGQGILSTEHEVAASQRSLQQASA